MSTKDEPIITNLINNLKQHSKNTNNSHLGLIFGPASSGKTTLFNRSSLEHVETITETNNTCHTWYNNQAVFLEINETMLSEQLKLQRYIKTFRKFYKRHSIDSITICINIFDSLILKPRELLDQLKKIKDKIHSLQKLLKGANLFICFTQLDKIAGFCHSFSDVNCAWGYSFQHYPNIESLIKQQDEKYQKLLSTLHETIIERVHHTKDALTRYLIREFPIQMESISNMVRACVKHLTQDQLNTSAVFFTAATQGNQAYDRLSQNITQTFSLTINAQVPQSSRNNQFFIDGFIQQISTYHNTKVNKMYQKRLVATSFASVLFTLGIIATHYTNSSYLYEAGYELKKYKNLKNSDLATIAQSINHLEKAEYLLDKTKLVDSEISSYHKQLKIKFSSDLKQHFLPTIAKQLELLLSERLTPSQTYYTLKTYMMLGGKITLDKQYLSSWLNDLWKQNKVKNLAELNQLLNVSLGPSFNGTKVNTTTIATTQSYMQSLPEDYLYFQLISNSLPKDKKHISLNFIKPTEITIPALYQKQYFTNIYSELLPTLGAQLKADNILQLNNKLESPTKSLQKMYLTKYVRWWQQLSEKHLPVDFYTFKEGATLFTHLASENSPLEVLRELLQNNTLPFEHPITKAERLFNQEVSRHYTALNMLTKHQSQQIQPIFSDLAHYFSIMSRQSDSQRIAFEIAKTRFLADRIDPISQLYQVSNALPEPLSPWIESLANTTWSIILSNAKDHINERWQKVVYQEYVDHINQRFPFTLTSKNEVRKEDFVSFFNPNGKLSIFIEDYLSPFIDRSSATWKPRTKDGFRLPLSKQTLNELIRANVIKEMFFANGNIEPRVQFTMQTVALEPLIKSLQININGQEINDTQENLETKDLIWPDNTKSNTNKIVMENIEGNTYEIKEDTYWGLFRLLAKANLIPLENSTTSYQVILDINGHASKFLLTANQAVNPFIPNILSSLSLPKELT